MKWPFRLDANKTNDPRAWAMDPGSTKALRVWKQFLGNPGDDELVFTTPEGKQYPQDCFASLLRASLKTAGVTRPELLKDGINTKRIRAHDLRGPSSPWRWPTARRRPGWQTSPVTGHRR